MELVHGGKLRTPARRRLHPPDVRPGWGAIGIAEAGLKAAREATAALFGDSGPDSWTLETVALRLAGAPSVTLPAAQVGVG